MNAVCSLPESRTPTNFWESAHFGKISSLRNLWFGIPREALGKHLKSGEPRQTQALQGSACNWVPGLLPHFCSHLGRLKWGEMTPLDHAPSLTSAWLDNSINAAALMQSDPVSHQDVLNHVWLSSGNSWIDFA